MSSEGKMRTDRAKQSLAELKNSERPFVTGKVRLNPLTEFIAGGGEKLVFTSVGRNKQERGLVAKVPYDLLVRTVLNREASEIEVQDGLERIAERTRIRFEKLERKFGDHVAKEETIVDEVPISQGVTNQIFQEAGQNRVAAEILYVPTVLTIQERVPSDLLEWSRTFGYRYVEANMESVDHYKYLNGMLLDESKPFNKDLFLKTLKRGTQDLLISAETDTQLRDKLIDFVKRAIEFTNEESELMDLFGDKNVIVFNDNGKWDYMLLDVLLHEIPSGFHKELQDFFIFDKSVGSSTLNAINYARTMHGLTLALGLSDRLNFVKEVTRRSAWEDRSEDLFWNIRSVLIAHGVFPRPQDSNSFEENKTAAEEVISVADSEIKSNDDKIDK